MYNNFVYRSPPKPVPEDRLQIIYENLIRKFQAVIYHLWGKFNCQACECEPRDEVKGHLDTALHPGKGRQKATDAFCCPESSQKQSDFHQSEMGGSWEQAGLPERVVSERWQQEPNEGVTNLCRGEKVPEGQEPCSSPACSIEVQTEAPSQSYTTAEE